MSITKLPFMGVVHPMVHFSDLPPVSTQRNPSTVALKAFWLSRAFITALAGLVPIAGTSGSVASKGFTGQGLFESPEAHEPRPANPPYDEMLWLRTRFSLDSSMESTYLYKIGSDNHPNSFHGRYSFGGLRLHLHRHSQRACGAKNVRSSLSLGLRMISDQ